MSTQEQYFVIYNKGLCKEGPYDVAKAIKRRLILYRNQHFTDAKIEVEVLGDDHSK